MIKALPKNVILEYTPPKDYIKRESGIIIMSEQYKHLRKKGKDRVISINKPEDVVRIGKVVSSGVSWIAEGRDCFFNRHDADPFSYDGKNYYRIKAELIMSYV